MASIDGASLDYAAAYVTTTNATQVRANTISATNATSHAFNTRMVLIQGPTGGAYANLFTCQSGEFGILVIQQSSFTSSSVGGIWAYNYVNGVGNIYLLYRSGTTVLVQFSGATIQANNGNLSLLWRKMRIN